MNLVERYALPPDQIEAQSLGRVGAVLDQLCAWDTATRRVVERMVYAAGDLSLIGLTRVHPAAVAGGIRALRGSCSVLLDTRTVVAALDHPRLTAMGCTVRCTADAPEGERTGRWPRAVFAMRACADEIPGSIVVVGTAPTALLALLDLVDEGLVAPALIIGTPVGFTAAAESKAELAQRAIPYITVEGTRGGAALAAAALNALLRLATASTTTGEDPAVLVSERPPSLTLPRAGGRGPVMQPRAGGRGPVESDSQDSTPPLLAEGERGASYSLFGALVGAEVEMPVRQEVLRSRGAGRAGGPDRG